ncbi:hypothetical protein OOJ91_12895 [Micromonospora lupini]|uniref:hypothetical protein n=1 Tax=Micromonospora lupini TaxID=285679 RepID=UPI00224CACEF|nr:hypothetical protein [Micromonospora lupini]MCX5066744.1 hypothetical protein [Micromonospora lupini]
MSLYPTKTRVRLLQDVADGLVQFSPHGHPAVANVATTPPANVLAAASEQRQAGWIHVDITEGKDVLGAYPYNPTGAGWGILAAHGNPDLDSLPPVWLLDVDGVVNAREPGWSAAAREGTAYYSGVDYILRWAPALIERIEALHLAGTVEVRWCSTWCAYVDQLERLWSLPELGRAFTEDINGYAAILAKIAAARRVIAEGRRLVWTDDDVVPMPNDGPLHGELTADGRALLIRPDHRVGLQPEHLDAIEAFAQQTEDARHG